MFSMSPTRTSRAGLAAWPLEVMRPRSQALEASERVLKKRAAQSHLSMRTLSMVQSAAMHLSFPTSTGVNNFIPGAAEAMTRLYASVLYILDRSFSHVLRTHVRTFTSPGGPGGSSESV